LGFTCVIVSNQPAAAKGKTTRANLEAVHAEILKQVQREGGRIANSYICFHKAEDHCACRKPNTGLLEQAFKDHPKAVRSASWMVGDGLTDIQAGQRFGLQTAFLAAHKCDTCQTARKDAEAPTLWVNDLEEFTDRVKGDLR
jgi:D-glycero-D-manno-heptose 1,7-bisphosphate phosphatase